jgi:tryptophanyl-tRNA synthetase
VANLLDILAACTGGEPARLAARFDGYGELKRAVADAVVDTLAPLRERYLELTADPERVRTVLRDGAERARHQAADTVRRARTAIGLLPC